MNRADMALMIKELLTALPGRANAIKGDALLVLIRERAQDYTISNRAMRRAIEKHLPKVCSCATGYYWPATIGEREAAIAYEIKKIRGLRRRIESIAEGFPQLEAYVQMELPMHMMERPATAGKGGK